MKTPMPPEPIQISYLEAIQMIMKCVTLCSAEELEELINENPALLAYEDNGTYMIGEKP